MMEIIVVPEDAERMLGKQLGGCRAFLGVSRKWQRRVSKKMRSPQ
jgi:hypothetical protein